MDPSSFDKILSDREIEILALLAVPYSDGEVGAVLGISPGTAEKHRFNMLRKLGLATTTELVRFARKRGIVRSLAPTHNEIPARWSAATAVPLIVNRLSSDGLAAAIVPGCQSGPYEKAVSGSLI